ncbi:hypothetical protein HYH03_012040 [Edaphochlamys debaryana]|uniref:Glycosyl transferase CAP10 domain-containing protein n=1 Tax=Edaphochlamys debaryana TaxID=47281 RepID=A0A836BVU7_9CHLO|nr:hypothetical protein HYH03_012040 [Edaphochlamys debaryana]|eukprot:KAG2489399.1 hypothetical protein HYH03_012040 [Edaphochlamys debaryana]
MPRSIARAAQPSLRILYAVLATVAAYAASRPSSLIEASSAGRSSSPISQAEGGLSDGDSGGRRLRESSFAEAANYTALECSRYDKTYEQIEADLRIHREMGTHLNATKYIASRLGSVQMRGLTVGFFGGKAMLLVRTDFKGLSHHAKLHMAYIRMLLHLEDCFGSHIPDVAFVLTTSDTPRYVSATVVNASHPALPTPLPAGVTGSRSPFVPPPYPVLGIGKSDYWPDLLLVPNFHFHMKLYDNVTLGAIPDYTRLPWGERKEVLFGRFSRYRMNRFSGDPHTYKWGAAGRKICYNANQTCPTREYFVKRFGSKHRERIDVSFEGKRSMLNHTAFKYVVNLEGQGISSRLEQLLPLGSLVFKEASGYYAYYYRTLLRHRGNLVEFWRVGPEEVLAEMDWAAAHDDEARRIAEAGVQTVQRYLTSNGRTCYWYRLLHGLHSTLAYAPSLEQWAQARPLREVVADLEAREEAWTQELLAEPWAP